ncbi:MAG TPA: TetR/AcrR family transcriptional regulator [Candidatus Bathyarchaeia archaeon]|nr:TetR/AcrR family transcriptional regulator [Candidatus Bathyarchaeia archaeon]
MPKVTLEYKELVRTRILESAHRVFSQKGYREATMDEIAEGLGLSKPALYRYYKSKEELFREIFKLFNQATAKALRESFKGGRLDGETFFALIDKWGWTPNLFLSAASEAPRNPKLRKILAEGYKTGVDMVGSFIDELKNRGILRDTADSRQIAMGAIAVHDGLLIWEVAGMNREETRKAFVEIIQTMFSSHLVATS